MELKDILETCKAEAIANTVSPTELSIWRDICRSYSKKFSTPLHLCLDGTISAEDIILAEFEDQMEGFDPDENLETVLDRIYSLEDPDYESGKERELDDFVKQAAKEDLERIRKGKPIHKALAKETDLKNTSEKMKETELPKSGGINLSYLQDEEGPIGNGFD